MVRLAVCNIESLSDQHRRWCEEVRGYVPPGNAYMDNDGVIHDPAFRLPTHNPKNYTRSGMYVLDFGRKYKEDPEFRQAMKMKNRMELGLD